MGVIPVVVAVWNFVNSDLFFLAQQELDHLRLIGDAVRRVRNYKLRFPKVVEKSVEGVMHAVLRGKSSFV